MLAHLDFWTRAEELKPDSVTVRTESNRAKAIAAAFGAGTDSTWVSAKQLFRQKAPGPAEDLSLRIRKASEHGLGHLLHPADPGKPSTDWIRFLWVKTLLEHLGVDVPDPDWFRRPACSYLAISTPQVLSPFQSRNEGKSYQDQVKPFGFMLNAVLKKLGTPPGSDPTEFQPVAPYTPEPERWLQMYWTNKYSNDRVYVTTARTPHAMRQAQVKSYREVFEEYRVRPEVKSTAPDDGRCHPQTRGQLQRRRVKVDGLYYIGKESNEIERIRSGAVSDWIEVREAYTDLWEDCARPGLDETLNNGVTRREIAERVGVEPRTISAWRNGTFQPSKDN